MSRGVRQSQLPTALLRLCACAPGLTGQLSDWCMRLVKKNLNSNIRKLSILKPYIFKLIVHLFLEVLRLIEFKNSKLLN